jgi:DNA-binding HxlR family transcriptional regulator
VPSYGQFCPLAKAMELLDERWTMLVVGELLLGSEHFNELRRGVPKMSPPLLSRRLQALTRAGVVERSDVDGRTCYTLTKCGRELRGVVQPLGIWGVRWMGELGDEDLDPHLLMWEIRRAVPIDAWPRQRTTLAFTLSGVAPKASSWWLTVADGQVDVCEFDPGYDVTATVSCSLRTLTQIWRGDVSWSRGLLAGSVTIDGPSQVRSSFATSASVCSSCRACLFPKRIHGVNSRCSSAVSVNTCSGDRAPSSIRSLPAWAFPSWQPWSRTGGRPRPWSWSLPRCASASCCTGGGGSRLPPIAKKQQCSTQPSTSWTQPNMSSSSENDPPRSPS